VASYRSNRGHPALPASAGVGGQARTYYALPLGGESALRISQATGHTTLGIPNSDWPRPASSGSGA